TYGRELGVAFQLIDDLLDYAADSADLGKNGGDDLAEGKPTLPLIYALSQCSELEHELLRKVILKGGRGDIDRVLAIVESTGALQYTARRAQEAAAMAVAALDPIPESDYKRALQTIAEFSVQRSR
ncbi:MAG: polyprenyl synthetase family protein, partial [Pseudomonadota bacterium]